MKVKKPMSNKTTAIQIKYSKHPDDGEGIAKLMEWENGEGYDLFLGEGHVELTHCEIMAIVALAGMVQCNLGKGA
jgi:hypothetical protein